MGLYIGMVRAKDIFKPLPGQVLHLVYEFASAIVPFARVSLGVLVCQMAAHSLHHRYTNEVLRSYEFNPASLSFKFPDYGRINLGVGFSYCGKLHLFPSNTVFLSEL